MSTAVIARGLLRKNQQEFIIRRLQNRDIPELYGLHKLILSNLHPDQQQFIHHKSRTDFQNMLDNPNQLLIGAFVGDKLIGYSSANFINQRNMDNVLPGFNLNYNPEEIVVLEQASVNPAYRGNNLASIMNAARQKIAFQEYGRRYAVTMVDIHNYYSYRNALRNGMCITQAAIDPEDNGHIVYLSKDIANPPRFNAQNMPLAIAYNEMNIATVSVLLKNNYVAHSFDDERGEVIFSYTDSFDNSRKIRHYKNENQMMETCALMNGEGR